MGNGNTTEQKPVEQQATKTGDGWRIQYDVILKTILFSLVYYVINNDLTKLCLNRFRSIIDINVLQTLIFGLTFMAISMFI